jgi:divalent metal cation (Fe/Co/Zn/Cd) transporter
MSADIRVTPEQLAEERSLLFALVADVGILTAFLLVGLFGGSLTLTAEFIRGSLMNMIELFALVVMRRIHRGVLADLEFGTGKLEQIANLVIGVGMLGGAAWIVVRALAIVVGERTVGAPFGLALAAITGALNAYVNLLAWDAMRRAARSGSSLVSSLVVTVTMTIAALSTDNVVVAWADAGGSIFVAVFIFANAIAMLQAGVPDLLDRSAGKAVRASVERALARHAGEYRRLDRLRSRRSGRVVFIEIALSFEAGLTIAEVNRRIEILRQAISREIEHADISILALANPEPA